ncbi:hypothetical protein BKA70DRAFT_1466988 [Coprinopsis sp. MPI-PUGE-AT-0042]|nr:hypothetical protein BKA70DRAFT_1466988 [Coprinopsis sp. MPI-PUGE-AT-0042]
MFILKIRKSFPTPPGDDISELDLEDAAHSGQRQVDMPCPWATGAINYTTSPSPAGSVVEMSGIRSHNIDVLDAATVASPGDGVTNIASNWVLSLASAKDDLLTPFMISYLPTDAASVPPAIEEYISIHQGSLRFWMYWTHIANYIIYPLAPRSTRKDTKNELEDLLFTRGDRKSKSQDSCYEFYSVADVMTSLQSLAPRSTPMQSEHEFNHIHYMILRLAVGHVEGATTMAFSLTVKKAGDTVDFGVNDTTSGLLGWRRLNMPSPYGEGTFDYATGAQKREEQQNTSSEEHDHVTGGNYSRAGRDINITNHHYPTNTIIQPTYNPLAVISGMVNWSAVWQSIVTTAQIIFKWN